MNYKTVCINYRFVVLAHGRVYVFRGWEPEILYLMLRYYFEL
jgi:hypothetical protein